MWRILPLTLHLTADCLPGNHTTPSRYSQRDGTSSPSILDSALELLLLLLLLLMFLDGTRQRRTFSEKIVWLIGVCVVAAWRPMKMNRNTIVSLYLVFVLFLTRCPPVQKFWTMSTLNSCRNCQDKPNQNKSLYPTYSWTIETTEKLTSEGRGGEGAGRWNNM